MRWMAIIAAAALLAAGAGFFYWRSPSVALKRATQHALNDFSAAMTSKDRAGLAVALGNCLAGSAQVTLRVRIFKPLMDNDAPGPAQTMDKKTFLAFVDNTL